MTRAKGRPRVLFAQFANPGTYPPVLNVAAILQSELGVVVRFVGATTAETAGMAVPADLGSGHRLVDLPPPGWRHKVAYLRWLAATVSIGIWWRADLVYVSDLFAAPAGVLLGLLRLDVVYHEHDYPPPELNHSFWIRLLLRARRRMGRIATACVAPGDDRVRRLVGDIDSNGRTHSVLNCPRKVEIPPDDGRGKSAHPILHYHGSVGEPRLPLSVVEALTLLPNDVVLQVNGYETIGTIGYLDRLRKRSVELGVAERVTIRTASGTRRDLFEVCRSASIGLMLVPTDSADFNMRTMAGASNKVFDYLACGLPIVVSDAPGLGDLVRAAEVGEVCVDLSPGGIAAAVSSLLNAPEELRNMALRGRRLIEEDWNFDVQFRPVLDVLRTALGSNDGGGGVRRAG